VETPQQPQPQAGPSWSGTPSGLIPGTPPPGVGFLHERDSKETP
jgi:hypothetical protein